VLRLESQREGFAIFWKEEPLLLHSAASPCLKISESAPIQWAEPGRGGGRWVRKSFRPSKRLKAYQILSNSPERIVLNFEGRLGLEIAVENEGLHIELLANDAPPGSRIDLACRADEAIFGGGPDSEALIDVSRSRIEAWCCDAGHAGLEGLFHRPHRGRDWPTMSFVTASRRWYRLDNRGWTAADFRSKGRLGFEFSSLPATILVGVGENAASTLIGLGRRSGESLVPPRWCSEGPIVATSESAATLGKLLDRLAAAGIKPSGVRLLDHDALDPASLGDPRIGLLRKRGIRALAVVRPGAAAARELDATTGEGSLPVPAAIAFDPGIEGLRIEHGAFLALPVEIATGRRPEEVVSWRSRLISAALRSALGEGGGSGGTAVQDGNFLLSSDRGWGMEEAMHCCSLPALVSDVAEIPRRSTALLVHGMSGGGWAWLDASSAWRAGSRRRASSEGAGLAKRRAVELAAFGPVLEFEAPREDSDGGLGPDEELRFLSRMSSIYSALAPYHNAVASEYRDTPLPPIRHALVHYEDGVEPRKTASQYLYGRDLLVAASGSQGDFVSLDLPADEWIHLWSSRRFRGGNVSIEAPPGQPAVFYRASSPFDALFDSIRREARRK